MRRINDIFGQKCFLKILKHFLNLIFYLFSYNPLKIMLKLQFFIYLAIKRILLVALI